MLLEAQKAPVSKVDPFCREFFQDPFPAYEELRGAGPVVRLSRYDFWAVARYAEVHRVLNDWQTFCSSRGAGLTDFAKEKSWRPPSLVLEVDPPFHDRTRRVLSRVLSAAVIRGFRDRFAQQADVLVDILVGSGCPKFAVCAYTTGRPAATSASLASLKLGSSGILPN